MLNRTTEDTDEQGEGPGVPGGRRPRNDRTPLERRQRLLVWGSIAIAVLSVIGLIASRWVKSAADVAAETAAPPPNLLTAPVVFRVLDTTVIIRGSFRTTRTVTFTPSEMLAPDGTEAGSGVAVVSKVLKRPGARVQAGQVLVEVAYRPVFTLRGKVPAVRDMVEGRSGPDIEQLQRALTESGYGTGADEPGCFGPGTVRAVVAFYERLGYPVPMSSEAAGEPCSGGAKPGDDKPAKRAKVMVPMSEVAFVPSFPARVSASTARVGGKVTEPLISLSTAGLRLTGRLDPGQADQVKAGQSVKVLSESDDREWKGRVSGLGTTVIPGQKDGAAAGGSAYVPVQITPNRPWPVDLDGQDVRITIVARSTDSPVLAVPQAAVSSAADGTASITVVSENGSPARRRVQVKPGISAEGYVQITPVDGEVREGDHVVVGQ